MFRKLTDNIYASPQITLQDVAEAAKLGVTLMINNRPEGESEDQTPGNEIEARQRAAGIDYVAIPVTHSGFSEPQVKAMAKRWKSRMGRCSPIAARARARPCYGRSPRPARAATPMR
jgi:uncharacterized protein (TIGR01244 family)